MKILYTYEGDFEAPKMQTESACAVDLVFNGKPGEVKHLSPGESIIIPTGVSVAIPTGYVGLVAVRSSMGFKYDVGLSNNIGIIDSDYRGEIKVKLIHHGSQSVTLTAGDRVAQLLIVPCVPLTTGTWERTTHLPETKRGGNGFGSTGK